MAMQMDPYEANKYISILGRWMTPIDGEAYRRVLHGLAWSTHMSLYGNVLHTTHNDLTTRLWPSQYEGIPKILVELTPPTPCMENPYIELVFPKIRCS